MTDFTEQTTHHAVILAAGEGKRMYPVTASMPKCLVRVTTASILENMLDNLISIGVTQVKIVVGYLAHQIRNRIGTHYKGITIEYIYNHIFRTTNSMYSLAIALNSCSCRTWILESDIFFEPKLIKTELNAAISWFADSSITMLDGAYLFTSETKRVNALEIVRDCSLLKPRAFKSSGILHFDLFGVNTVKDWLRNGIQQNKSNLYFDLIIAEHIQEIDIEVIDVAGSKWYEIDTLTDLDDARDLFL